MQDGRDVDLRDATEELAVIGLWGPRGARRAGRGDRDDVSSEGFPFMRRGGSTSRVRPCSRSGSTYVGELGWELYVEPEWADTGVGPAAAGGPASTGSRRGLPRARFAPDREGIPVLRDGSHHARRSVRGRPRTSACDWRRRSFVGREALVAKQEAGPPTRRLRTILVGGAGLRPDLRRRGGPADGAVVGRLRSCAYGFTVRRNIGVRVPPVARSVPATDCRSRCSASMSPPRSPYDAVIDPDGARIRV